MMLYEREKTSTHPKAVLTNENTKYVKNANINPYFTESRAHDPRIALGHAELFLFLCVNKALRVLTVTKEALRDGFSNVNVQLSLCAT